MKKAALITILALLAGGALQAQRPQHQIYGDTMFGQLDKYYYTPWWVLDDWEYLSEPDSIHTTEWMPSQCGTFTGLNRPGQFRYHYTDRPINIIGIAGVAYSVTGFHLNESVLVHHLDSTLYPEYFMLYDAMPDTLMFKGELQWSPRDSCRYLQLPLLVNVGQHCDQWNRDTITFEIREYYFEKPITVADSFYVGGTGRSQAGFTETLEYDDIVYSYYACIKTIGGSYYDGIHWPPFYCPRTYTHYIDHFDHFDFHYDPDYWYTTEVWRHKNHKYFTLIFPLYEVLPTMPQGDTLACAKPTRLRVDDMTAGDGVAHISWDDHQHHTSWDVAYGDTLFETLQHELLPIRGLAPGKTYQVAVRAHCQSQDTLCYSDWSDTLTFTFDTLSTDPTGILLPGEEDEVLSIEYYDLLGRPLPQPPARGLYIRRTTTTQGTTTRKIVRQ